MDKNTIDTNLATKILKEISQDKMGGWFDFPYKIKEEELGRIKQIAEYIRQTSKVLVCIGIGGSYLGHRAVIEALKPKSPTRVVYAGNSLSEIEMKRTIEDIGADDFSLLVISKSGNTLEPAVAFRVFKDLLIKKYGVEGARKRIFTITDADTGSLHDETVAYGYVRLDIPRNIGGRYSVMSSVGLLPMAVAGVDIDKFLRGMKDCREKQLVPGKFSRSALLNYAFSRRFLYEHGVKIEVLSCFEPSMMYFIEWWKQLFGESEGKNGGGLFPAGAIFTTDLHSLGQYLQEGSRDLLETFIKFGVTKDENPVIVPLANQNEADKNNLLSFDKINYIGGKSVNKLNDIAFSATVAAHDRGGISTVVIEMNDEETGTGLSERTLGFLMYFFMVACAVSAKLNGVNPFDQPGVEAYKTEMKKLLIK